MEALQAFGSARQPGDAGPLQVGSLAILTVPPPTRPPSLPPFTLTINGMVIPSGTPVLCTVTEADPDEDTVTVATLGGPYGPSLEASVTTDLALTQPPVGALALMALSTGDVVRDVPRRHLARDKNPLLTPAIRRERI